MQRVNIIPYTLVKRIGRCGLIYLDKVLFKDYDNEPNPNDILRKRKKREEKDEILALENEKLYGEFNDYMCDYKNQKHQDSYDEVLSKIEEHSIRKIKKIESMKYESIGLDADEGFDEKR